MIRSNYLLLSKWFLIIFFVAMISAPLFTHIGGIFDTSYVEISEKRIPHNFPGLSVFKNSGKQFFNATELYLNDHFGFRYWLVRANSFIRFKLGVSTSEKVVFGKEGWLFYSDKNIIEQYRGVDRFTNNDLDDWVEAANSRKKWLNARGIEFFFAVFPEKSSVYTEYLPDRIDQIAPTRLSQLKKRLSGNNTGFIDVTPAVFESKASNPLYFKTDSHWNFHGGFVAYSEIMKSVRKLFPEIKTVTEKDMDIEYKPSYSQDLTQILNLSGVLEDTNADAVIRKSRSHVTSIKPVGIKDRLPFIVKTDIKDAPRALIIRDSYTDFMEPYINETFSSVLYVYHGKKTPEDGIELCFGPDIQDLVLDFKPDIVIHAMVERVLRYKMSGPVADDYPVIKDWQPKVVFQGGQHDGNQLLVKAENLKPSAVVELDGKALHSYVDSVAGTVRATIPDNIIGTPGDYRLLLKNSDVTGVSREVWISVKAYKAEAPKIVDWGPKEVTLNVPFNVQGNGLSAMWIKASCITPHTVIVWDGHFLQSNSNVKDGVITASVPDALFQAPGTCRVVLKNIDDGLFSGESTILVKALN